jgi:hypothetical protein
MSGNITHRSPSLIDVATDIDRSVAAALGEQQGRTASRVIGQSINYARVGPTGARGLRKRGPTSPRTSLWGWGLPRGERSGCASVLC